MFEDKLLRHERIRLEALAQANTACMGRAMTSAEQVINIAKKFESYIINGDDT